ncbi:MAG: acetate--CoA ligase family protein [Candidatus Magasanikbacteria bacterium]|nr:acetate--CoA ligase family protein [Candidatus Magasanikbacteria bacterium]
MNLKTLFNPRTVAVIGAADDPKKLGYALVYNLLQNKKRKVIPVNPSFKKVLGLRCFSSLSKVKDKIDLVIIAVKPEIVPLVLKDCGEKKIPHAIIITAGFKEIGGAGAEREKELKAIAKKYKINIVGPNCLGVLDTESNLNGTFGSETMPKKGPVAFISQSGAVGTAMLDWAMKNNVGFSKFVSIGNEAGATENDFLEYLGKDRCTSAILMYLEGITDGKRFMRQVKKISAKKPVVILKAGLSERGLKAVASHTGSLAPSREIFRTACRQSGAILVDSLGAMFNLAKLLNGGLYSAPNEWVILTNGGGPSIVTADLIESTPNLNLFAPDEALKNKLSKVLPATAALNNPVDIIGDALSDRYEAALKILTADKKVKGIMVILTPQKMTRIKETAVIVAKYASKIPIIPLFIGGAAATEAEKVFTKHNLVNFIDPYAAVEAVSSLASPIKKKEDADNRIPSEDAGPMMRQMRFNECVAMLYQQGLKISGDFIAKKENLRRFSEKNKFPWAMKVMSEQIVHKTDVGGVRVNINSLAEAEKAWKEIYTAVTKKMPGVKIEGFIVQPMSSGREVIIGMKRDPSFGPVIVFGLGGVFVETLKDASMRISPINDADAMAMIYEIKAAAILRGVRGEPSVDISALAKIIVAVSKMAEKHKNIKEIDFNPVMARPDGADIVDVRIMVER